MKRCRCDINTSELEGWYGYVENTQTSLDSHERIVVVKRYPDGERKGASWERAICLAI